jgi:transposase
LEHGTTILFGLSGVRVESVDHDVGVRVVHVRTADDAAAGCPSCGVVSTSVKEYPTTTPKDLPYGEVPIEVRWRKRRWRCREQTCPRRSFTEVIEELPVGARTTGRLRRAMASAVGDACRSVAEVAESFGVSWPTAHKAFVAEAEKVLTEPAPTPVLGIDETRRGRPRWRFDPVLAKWCRVDPYDTGFVDLHGSQGLLGLAEGRTTATVVDWLNERSCEFRAAIRYVAIDPAAVYAAAIRTPGLLPNATLVVDHFHLVKLANDAVTKVRRRVTWEQHDRRGRKVDPAWANRRRLLKGRERLSTESFQKMWASLEAGDPSAQILTAWIAKEELRTLLALARSGARRDQIRERLYLFYAWCARANIPELTTLATTIETWWPAILAFIDTGITNAKTEGLNRLLKQVKRSACGFRTVPNSHRRVRFHCTRRHRATAANFRSLPGQS